MYLKSVYALLFIIMIVLMVVPFIKRRWWRWNVDTQSPEMYKLLDEYYKKKEEKMDKVRIKEIYEKIAEGKDCPINWKRRSKFDVKLYIYLRDILLDILEVLREEKKK